jgi:hypothetical protein
MVINRPADQRLENDPREGGLAQRNLSGNDGLQGSWLLAHGNGMLGSAVA